MTDEPMVERLEGWEAMPDATFPHNWCITGPSTIPGDRVYIASHLSESNAKAIVALLSQLREQRERTSFWETLHDERVESLEAERDKALRMRDYWYAEFKRTVDPVNNPHRCSSECAENPTCPVILAYDQDATDAGYQLCDCGHFHRPRTDCGNWWFYPDVLTGRACGCTEWRKPR